ncbi:ABC transporter protein [Halorhabdus tiamatea SARL4B]|uniref:ABC transporter protein n=1 Tax=Halorhabdus tiamatea SARL4B TaxID=1033806 RepID=F7PG75_9EURY|nr:ABC transporter permease [Halorhabdus tiamatea]ERJ06324.1 ABC transporter protein [Halorhabdus tiamatea SARL4B]CCQ34624.1 ABC-2 type transporter, permease protein [Halorhabdus tiamatea SARL4B]
MRRIAALLGALLRDWSRSRETVFFVVLFPIILLMIFSTVFAASAPSFGLVVQNQDVGTDGEATNLSATFVENLEGIDPLNVRHLDADRNLTEWSQEGDGDGSRVLVLPEGFAEDVRAQSGRVRIAIIRDTVRRVQDDLNESERATVQSGLDQADQQEVPANATGARLQFYAPPDDQSAAVVRGILSTVVAEFNQRSIGVEEPPVSLESGTIGSAGLTSTDYYLPAFIATLVLINGVMTVPGVIAGFHQDGTLKRLVATPLRKRDWIVANVLQQSLLALLLSGVMLVVAAVLFGVTVIPGPLSIALVLLGAIAFSALGMTLGSLLPNPDAASSLGGSIAFPMMFLSGVFWEIDIMPETLQTIGRLMPLYQFHRGLRRLMIVGTTDGVWPAFAMLGGMAVVFVALAVRLTRWRDFGG